jgi:hypothetical protein
MATKQKAAPPKAAGKAKTETAPTPKAAKGKAPPAPAKTKRGG